MRELRRSQRFGPKKERTFDNLGAESTTTMSQESDFEDDDDGLSTPNADMADKSILSNLSVRYQILFFLLRIFNIIFGHSDANKNLEYFLALKMLI